MRHLNVDSAQILGYMNTRQQVGLVMTHPHGDRQAAVDVGFLKPSLLHDASPLGAQWCWVLADTNTTSHLEYLHIIYVGYSRWKVFVCNAIVNLLVVLTG